MSFQWRSNIIYLLKLQITEFLENFLYCFGSL